MDRQLRPSSDCAWAQSGLDMNCLYTARKFKRSVFLQKTYFDSFTCILCPGPCFGVVNPYPVNIFCPEILSDFYVCCIYSCFYHRSKHYMYDP